MEQTKVYQNQPTPHHNHPVDQTQVNRNPSVQVSTHPTPKTPSDSAVLQKTRPNQKVHKKPGRNRSNPDEIDQNWIEGDPEYPTQRPYTNAGFDRNGAIWVTEITGQPGFLFPVARTTSMPAVRRQIKEEASLSVLSQVCLVFIHY